MAIPLTQELYALIDGNDYEWLNQWKWCANYIKPNYCCARRKAKKNKRIIYMHRLIMTAPSNMQVDHINHNGLDNRRLNLRLVTNTQNAWNQRSAGGGSKYKGIYWNLRDRLWYANIMKNGKRVFLGCYKTEITAAKAYDKTAREYFGEFACLNFQLKDN